MSSLPNPLIGLTGGLLRNGAGALVCQVGQAYIAAIQQAGGTPVVIPVFDDLAMLPALLARLDGVVFTGGGDIDPQRYKGAPHQKVYGISHERDTLEFALLSQTLHADKPLLAICRGIQVLNVGLGGTLHTHIEDQVEHALKHDYYPDYPRDKLVHPVQFKEGSKLHRIIGATEIWVNSLHHQSIDRVGKGLEAIAFAPDGLVEGLNVTDARFALGVQWHPECLPHDPHMQALFRAFIQAC